MECTTRLAPLPHHHKGDDDACTCTTRVDWDSKCHWEESSRSEYAVFLAIKMVNNKNEKILLL
jgi:hypothetical protein